MQSILAKLNIQSNGPWGYVIYTIIILDILTLLLQKQSNIQITVLLAVSIMAALIDKIDAVPSETFGAFMDHIAMFVPVIVVAGMTRTERSRGPAILCGLIALVYTFARLYIK